jgi:hypothetical protein
MKLSRIQGRFQPIAVYNERFAQGPESVQQIHLTPWCSFFLYRTYTY